MGAWGGRGPSEWVWGEGVGAKPFHLEGRGVPGDFRKMLDNSGGGVGAHLFYLDDHPPGVKAVAGKGGGYSILIITIAV